MYAVGGATCVCSGRGHMCMQWEGPHVHAVGHPHGGHFCVMGNIYLILLYTCVCTYISRPKLTFISSGILSKSLVFSGNKNSALLCLSGSTLYSELFSVRGRGRERERERGGRGRGGGGGRERESKVDGLKIDSVPCSH